MRIPTRISLLIALTLLTAAATYAASPSLRIITPRGVQRGTDAVLTFSGARLNDAEEIFFYEPGVTVTKIEPANANTIKVHVKIAADCRLGEHTAQVRTKSGVSDYRTFFVGALPDVAEKEPNTEFDQPQDIPLNVTVTGTVSNEDVDYYRVKARKGQRISVEVEAMRLGTALFDPYVAILDARRFELSADDDTPLVRQDAVASIVAPEDGGYYIEVRESAYANGSYYRMHVGTFPRPTAVYPAGGKLGEEMEVRYIGDPAGEIKEKVKLPAEPRTDAEFGLFPQDAGGIAPSDNPFRLFEHGNAFEQEPNDDPQQATPVNLPLAFNGVIEKEGDVDFFRFSAKKGQVFEVECYARRIRTPLDAVMNLYQVTKADSPVQVRGLAGADDSRGPDPYIRFSVPADAEYLVRVTDHLGRGGPEFVYRVEFHPVRPSLSISIPRVTRYGQDRQQIVVPKGNRFATLISASRSNFGGELVLEGGDLPAGIKMIAQNMPANMNVMPVVFEAAPDAPVAGRLIDFTARHVDEKTGIRGGFSNRADFVRGAPGQSIYVWKDVNKLPVAVVEELPFKLEIVEPKVPLVRNGSLQLKIVVHRKDGFNQPVSVQFPFRPPGLGAASSINIPGDKSEGYYPLNANGGAAVGKWPVYVIGSSNVNGAAWASSQLATLQIAEPYVSFALDRGACEQGQNTEIVARVNVAREFPGEAKVKLLGLPHKVAAEEMTFNKDAKELVFKVATDQASPPGRHKSVFAQVVITADGEPIVHRNVGRTELRIDKPLPKAEPKPQPKQVAEKKPEPEKKPERRLTRLEQLRLEAKKRAEAAAKEGSK